MADTNQNEEILWKDRKHFMWFPITFTKYCVRRGRIFVDRGLLNTVQDQTLLYRIIDIQMRRSLAQRLFGTGTIILMTRVDNNREIRLENIRNPGKVNDFLSDLIEDVRRQKNVVGKEFFGSDHHGPDMMPPDMDMPEDIDDMDDMDMPD